MSLSVLAERYGAYKGKNSVTDSDITHRSALTPIDTLFPVDPATLSQQERDERVLNSRIEEIQRKLLRGFTTRELVDVDAFTFRKLKAGNLTSPVIPLLQLHNWEGMKPLRHHDRDYLYALDTLEPSKGFWVAENVLVHPQLTPCLQIASRLLTSMHLLPWFDALLLGDIRDIRKSRLPKGGRTKKGLFSFHQRDFLPAHAREAEKERDKMFARMEQNYNYKFAFCHGMDDPLDGKIDAGDDEHGVTYKRTLYGDRHLITFLNIKHFAPLIFEENLTDGERMGLQWHNAVTIVHEIMHAIWFAKTFEDESLEDALKQNAEAYFEEESIAEVGMSMENAVFGGTGHSMITEPRRPMYSHFGHWLYTNWPSYGDIEFAVHEPILYFLNSRRAIVPVPVSLYVDMQQTSFWDVNVKGYGLKLLRDKYPIQAAYIEYRNKPDADYPEQFEPILKPTIIKSMPGPTIPDIKPTLKELLSWSTSERALYDLKFKMRRSASSETDFWNHARTLDKIQIITVAVTGGNSAPLTQSAKQSLVAIFPDSIQAHLGMINALLRSEEVNEVVYPDRRQNLLRWNRGLRNFMRQLLQQISGDAAVYQSMETHLINLEYCWMRLAVPDNTPNGLGELYVEFDRVELALRNFDQGVFTQCLSTCNSLMDHRVSLLAMSCALIVSSQLKTLMPLPSRKTALTTGFDMLNKLKKGDGIFQCQNGWEGLIDQWMEKAVGIALQMEQEEAAAAAAVSAAVPGGGSTF